MCHQKYSLWGDTDKNLTNCRWPYCILTANNPMIDLSEWLPQVANIGGQQWQLSDWSSWALQLCPLLGTELYVPVLHPWNRPAALSYDCRCLSPSPLLWNWTEVPCYSLPQVIKYFGPVLLVTNVKKGEREEERELDMYMFHFKGRVEENVSCLEKPF